MADFNSAYHKFCPVEVNGCPRVRNLALPPYDVAHWLRDSLCINSECLMLYGIGIIVVLPIIVVIPPIVLTELELRKRFG